MYDILISNYIGCVLFETFRELRFRLMKLASFNVYFYICEELANVEMD